MIPQKPWQKKLAWLVYGGTDGSVLVFKPKPRQHKGTKWVKLLQTQTKNHGYWSVSIVDATGNHYKRDVQTIILLALVGPPPHEEDVAMHNDDDPDNNFLGNLAWGTKPENATGRYSNSPKRMQELEQLLGAKIILDCRLITNSLTVQGKKRKRTVEWQGEIRYCWQGVESTETSRGQNPSIVTANLLNLVEKAKQGVKNLPKRGANQ